MCECCKKIYEVEYDMTPKGHHDLRFKGHKKWNKILDGKTSGQFPSEEEVKFAKKLRKGATPGDIIYVTGRVDNGDGLGSDTAFGSSSDG